MQKFLFKNLKGDSLRDAKTGALYEPSSARSCTVLQCVFLKSLQVTNEHADQESSPMCVIPLSFAFCFFKQENQSENMFFSAGRTSVHQSLQRSELVTKPNCKSWSPTFTSHSAAKPKRLFRTFPPFLEE